MNKLGVAGLSLLGRAGAGAAIGSVTGLLGSWASGGEYGRGALMGALSGAGLGMASRQIFRSAYRGIASHARANKIPFQKDQAIKALSYGTYGTIGLGGGLLGGVALSGDRNKNRGFNGNRGSQISSGKF